MPCQTAYHIFIGSLSTDCGISAVSFLCSLTFFHFKLSGILTEEQRSTAGIKKSPKMLENQAFSSVLRSGAGNRGRTGTVSLPLDFESSTSANSIIPAHYNLIMLPYFFLFVKNYFIISVQHKRVNIFTRIILP